jgi:hypothetical protein
MLPAAGPAVITSAVSFCHNSEIVRSGCGAMLFWALLASGQITMPKADGRQSLAKKPCDQIFDLAA